MTNSDRARLRRLLKDLGLEASGITIPTFAPGLELLPTIEDRKLILNRLEKAIDLVYYLEGETVMYGICPVEIFGVSSSETRRWTLELFKKCSPLAEDCRVQVAVEFVNKAFPTSESIKEFLNDIDSDNIGLCLEVGNLNARPRCESLIEHVEKCKDWIRLVHLIDPCNVKWLEKVNVDLRSLFEKLHEINYRGYYVVEGFARPINCDKLDEEVSRLAAIKT